MNFTLTEWLNIVVLILTSLTGANAWWMTLVDPVTATVVTGIIVWVISILNIFSGVKKAKDSATA